MPPEITHTDTNNLHDWRHTINKQTQKQAPQLHTRMKPRTEITKWTIKLLSNAWISGQEWINTTNRISTLMKLMTMMTKIMKWRTYKILSHSNNISGKIWWWWCQSEWKINHNCRNSFDNNNVEIHESTSPKTNKTNKMSSLQSL